MRTTAKAEEAGRAAVLVFWDLKRGGPQGGRKEIAGVISRKESQQDFVTPYRLRESWQE